MPKRIQLSRRKGWRMPENAVKVDRSTKWGNPFVVGRDGGQRECVHLYRMLLAGNICLTCRADVHEQRAHMAFARDNIHTLIGKDLGCWCRPLHACHADVLLEYAAQREALLANAGDAK